VSTSNITSNLVEESNEKEQLVGEAATIPPTTIPDLVLTTSGEEEEAAMFIPDFALTATSGEEEEDVIFGATTIPDIVGVRVPPSVQERPQHS